MRTKTLASTLTQWELLAGSLELHQAELPTLLTKRAALADFITANRAAAAVQIEAEGTLKDAVARREEITRSGNHLVQFIAASLRDQFGPNSPRLAQFGVRPRALQRLATTRPPETPDGGPGEPPGSPPSDS